jgi:hypothetical protein
VGTGLALSGRCGSATCALAVVRAAFRFGRLTLLAGRPGCGKSLVTCDLAARISTNAHWPEPGFDRAPLGDTLLISAEDSAEDTIRPRLDAAGADCRRVHLLKAAKIIADDGNERSVAFDLSNVDLIRDALDRLPDCKLVVVDPIGSFLGGRVDAYRDNEVRSVLAPLAALAAERGVAVLLVCHTRKALASFADDMALGSRAFVGLARSVLHLMADPDDEKRKLLLPGKCNLSCPADGLAFRIVGDPAPAGMGTGPARRISRRRYRGTQGEPGNQTRAGTEDPRRGLRVAGRVAQGRPDASGEHPRAGEGSRPKLADHSSGTRVARHRAPQEGVRRRMGVGLARRWPSRRWPSFPKVSK